MAQPPTSDYTLSIIWTFAGTVIAGLLVVVGFFIKIWMGDKSERIKLLSERTDHLAERDNARTIQLTKGCDKMENHDVRLEYVEKNMVHKDKFREYCQVNDADHEKIMRAVGRVENTVGEFKEQFSDLKSEVQGGIQAITRIAGNIVDQVMVRDMEVVSKIVTEKLEEKDDD